MLEYANMITMPKWQKGAVLATLFFGALLFVGVPSSKAAIACPLPSTDAGIIALRGNFQWNLDSNAGTAWVTNNHPSCAYEFTLKSFKVNSETNPQNQSRFDSVSVVVQPGSAQPLRVNLPSCRYQIDLLLGSGAFSGATFLDGSINFGLPVCETYTPPPLVVSCFASSSSPLINQTVTWRANVSGGNGSYSYSWTGNDLFPIGVTTNPATASYQTAGQKSASVTVVSGRQTITANCTVYITEPPQQCVAPTITSSLWQTVRVGQSFYYAITSSGGTPPTNFLASGLPSGISFYGNTISGVFYTAGTYNIGITAYGGNNQTCGITRTLTIVVSDNPPPPPPPPPPPQPITADIKAEGSDSAITISYNSSANITWPSANATYCTVSPSGWTGISGGQPSGNLTSSRTYSVDCTGPGGSASDSVTVNVQNQQMPVSCSPENQTAQVGNPASFTATGGDGSFWWSTFDGSPGSGNGSSFQTYFFSSGPKTVTVRSGNTTDTCTVQVSQTQIPPTADIKAEGSDSAITISYNSSANITWTSANATYCTVSPSGWTGISGGQPSGNLTSSRTYSVNCTGPGGSASDSVTVNVQGAPQPPTADIKAGGSDTTITIPQNTATQITWSSTNATSCTVSPAGWTGISGDQSSGNLSNSQTYSVNCTGPGGSASDSVTVNIQNQQPAPTADIKANSYDYTITIPYNTQANITWTSANATYCTISPTGWTGTYGAQYSGSFTYSRTYSVNCTGPGGSASDSVTVNITQPNLPTVDIVANPRNINQGQNSVLSWTSTNADTCSASNGWSGGKSTYGSESVSPSYTTTYRITCANQYGIAEDTDTVTVGTIYNNPTNLRITKNSINRTTNQTTYSNFIEAQGQDVLEFEIRVRNNDLSSGLVTVRDVLPSELIYVPGSTQVNGNTVQDGIVSGGISLGYMGSNEEKVVRFRATVLPGTSARVITNQASATMNSGLQIAYATIQVKSRGQVLGAADIVTGPENVVPWMLALGFVASLIMYVIFFGRETKEYSTILATDNQVRVRTEKAEYANEFERMVAEIRSREKRPDTERGRFTKFRI